MVLKNDEQENETEESQSEEDRILEDLALRDVLVSEKKGITTQVAQITTRLKESIPATDSMDDGYRIGDWKVTNREVRTRRLISDRERFLEAVVPILLENLPNGGDENTGSSAQKTVEEVQAVAVQIWDGVRRTTVSQRFVQTRVAPDN